MYDNWFKSIIFILTYEGRPISFNSTNCLKWSLMSRLFISLINNNPQSSLPGVHLHVVMNNSQYYTCPRSKAMITSTHATYAWLMSKKTAIITIMMNIDWRQFKVELREWSRRERIGKSGQNSSSRLEAGFHTRWSKMARRALHVSWVPNHGHSCSGVDSPRPRYRLRDLLSSDKNNEDKERLVSYIYSQPL